MPVNERVLICWIMLYVPRCLYRFLPKRTKRRIKELEAQAMLDAGIQMIGTASTIQEISRRLPLRFGGTPEYWEHYFETYLPPTDSFAEIISREEARKRGFIL